MFVPLDLTVKRLDANWADRTGHRTRTATEPASIRSRDRCALRSLASSHESGSTGDYFRSSDGKSIERRGNVVEILLRILKLSPAIVADEKFDFDL